MEHIKVTPNTQTVWAS